jgi:hypothetical protein
MYQQQTQNPIQAKKITRLKSELDGSLSGAKVTEALEFTFNAIQNCYNFDANTGAFHFKFTDFGIDESQSSGKSLFYS